MRGRKPKPTRIKEVEGNPGRRPLNLREPKPDFPPGLPEPPEHLGPHARKEWSRAGKLLLDSRILTVADLPALEAYCVIYGRWSEAERNLQRSGLVVRVKGQPFPQLNPFLIVANQCLKQMRAFLVEFGMTPSSRVRIAAEEKPIEPGEKEKAKKYFM